MLQIFAITNVALIFAVLILWRKIATAERRFRQVRIEYTHDAFESKGLLKNKKKVTFKGQLYIGEFPVGTPFIIAEHQLEEINEERIERLLNEVIKPLIQLGLNLSSPKMAALNTIRKSLNK